MSLRDTKNFFIDDLEDINKKIDKVNSAIRDVDLSIEKTNYFIQELTGKASSDLAATYILEKEREEKLKKERESLLNYNNLKDEFEEELDDLLDRKRLIEKCSESVSTLIDENKKLSSKDKSNSINKKELNLLKKELIEVNEFITKSVNEFAYVDPNRIVTDFKIYEESMQNIYKKIDSLM